MKPMVYTTKYGVASIRDHDDGQIAIYDNESIPAVVLEDDDAFADWVFKVGGHYVGNFRDGERGRPVNE